MNNSSTLLLDVDGVLLDWYASFLVHELHGHQDHVPPDEFLVKIQHFNASPAFGQLRPCKSADVYIPALVRHGWSTHAISSCGTGQLMQHRRRKNLAKHFGSYIHDVTCLPLHDDKQAALADHEPTWFVDDHVKNCLAARQAGHDALLMTWPWTDVQQAREHDLRCVANWQEIHDIICYHA